MEITYVIIFLIISSVVSSYLNQAISPFLPKRDKPIVVCFFNGVGVAEIDAKTNLFFLMKATEDKDKTVQYEYFYNYTNGLFSDMLEVFEQSMAERSGDLNDLTQAI